jgi:CDP-glucose 4,6-dehydratase
MSNNVKNLTNFWKNKKVFLTGHTGFKGSWFSLMLNLLGAKVYGYSLKPNKKLNLYNLFKLKKNIHSSVIGDIRNYAKLKQSMLKASPDFIVHMAAQPLVLDSYDLPKKTYEVNTIGTMNILNIIHETNISKYNLIVTTDKVYENDNKNIFYKEIDKLGGNDPYSSSKACAELVTQAYNKSFFKKKKIFAVTARAGNIIGGGDFSKNRLLPDFFRSLSGKKNMTLRNPKSIRPWQYVLEPLYGYLLILMKLHSKKNVSDETSFNFGPKKINNIKVEHVIDLINREFKNSVKIKKKNINKYESKILMLNSNKSKKILNWESKINIENSIKLIASWHKDFLSNTDILRISKEQITTYLNNLD